MNSYRRIAGALIFLALAGVSGFGDFVRLGQVGQVAHAEPHIELVAGGGDVAPVAGAAAIVATKAQLGKPFGLAFDKAGDAIIVEMTGQRIDKIDGKGMLTALGGTGNKGGGGDDGPAAKAQFNGMHNLAIGPDGAIYLADTWNNKVRKLDPKTGIITTFAGTGEKGYGGDGGPANKAQFGQVINIALSPDGKTMYIADLDNGRVRAIDMATGIVTTAAGNGGKSIKFKDGDKATEVAIGKPRAVTVDKAGNLYILHRGKGGPLQVVNAEGRICTLLSKNNTGKPGPDGKKPDAMSGPKHLCIDGDGNVIIADTENHRVRKYIVKTGQMVDLAGTGKRGSAGVPGPPRRAQLAQPHGVTLDASGVLYISDSANNRVLKIVDK